MTHQPSEAELVVTACMEQIEAVMGSEFAGRLSDARCTELCEAEDRAVAQHGRLILAAIEGTTWASAGDMSTADPDESRLVQLVAS
jgi:hypothetical protein